MSLAYTYSRNLVDFITDVSEERAMRMADAKVRAHSALSQHTPVRRRFGFGAGVLIGDTFQRLHHVVVPIDDDDKTESTGKRM